MYGLLVVGSDCHLEVGSIELSGEKRASGMVGWCATQGDALHGVILHDGLIRNQYSMFESLNGSLRDRLTVDSSPGTQFDSAGSVSLFANDGTTMVLAPNSFGDTMDGPPSKDPFTLIRVGRKSKLSIDSISWESLVAGRVELYEFE
jgi:hypothetical protein